MVLLAGRLLREAVLQQSALSARDAFCAPAKGAALVDAVLSVYDRSRQLVAEGALASDIEDVDWAALIRAREETGPSDVEGVAARRDLVLEDLRSMSVDGVTR